MEKIEYGNLIAIYRPEVITPDLDVGGWHITNKKDLKEIACFGGRDTALHFIKTHKLNERYVRLCWRLNHTIRNHIRDSLRKKKEGKSWEKIVGYTLPQLMEHLESQFDKKMSWNNYGSYWHIDHIKPVSVFSFSSYKDREFQECWALTNLQPLERIENIRKGNKLEWT